MKKNALNILIAIESFFDGGAEIFAIRLANELSINHNVFFVELHPYLTVEKRQLSLLNIKNIKLLQAGQNKMGNLLYKIGINNCTKGLRKILYKFYLQNKKKQIIKFIKKNNIKIVNSHTWDSDLYFSILKNEISFNLVSSFHGHYEFLVDKRNNYVYNTTTALDAINHVIYTSPLHQKTLDSFLYSTNKRHKIFYGLAMLPAKNRTTYSEGDCLKIVMAARGIKEKGWEEAIEAVLLLQKKYNQLLKLYLIGEGAFLNYLKNIYTNSSIIFEGYKDDVRPFIENAHIGILPTYYIAESLPNTVIEYLFCGKPVVTTNAGAIKEMIDANGEMAGTCIEITNGKVNVNSIAAAIENYLQTPFLVQKHSAAAFVAAEKFTMKKCVEKYLEVFSYSIN